ncbi:MAG: NAD(P)-dependent dehydrogenase (short-subunit alcohol dehydrogenase family) [Shewanella sp.]|jgi:NAD(P)-dependent dehydrogenase (short-subunit alcohol dehydrogenase family)
MTVKYNYQHKVVLITGAASGFGKLAAQAFAQSGAKLALIDINQAALTLSVEEFRANNIEAIGLRCDISQNESVKAAIAQVKQHFGHLDIAINNAGIIHPMARLADSEERDFDRTISINLKGTFLCMKHELTLMQTQGHGVILNTASVSGLIGSPFLSIYSAAKHGVIGLTRSAALEYGRKGIRINAICPTFAHTPMLDNIVDGKGDDFTDKLAASLPMQRLAEPEEVVKAMLWLCSDDNSFMNGAAVTVDGGLTAG